MSFLAPDHALYDATYGDAIDAYGEPEDDYAELDDDDFDGLECACGRRMHASDVECRACWREREYPDA